MPKNTAAGIYIAAFAFLVGFGFVWHIIWMVVIGLLGVIVGVIVRTFNEDTEYVLKAEEVKMLEQTHQEKVAVLHKGQNPDAEDMTLREFIKVVTIWTLDFIRNKRWRTT